MLCISIIVQVSRSISPQIRREKGNSKQASFVELLYSGHDICKVEGLSDDNFEWVYLKDLRVGSTRVYVVSCAYLTLVCESAANSHRICTIQLLRFPPSAGS